MTFSEEELSEMCKKCHKKKIERKEAVVELIQTEINYGQDLRILKEVAIIIIITFDHKYATSAMIWTLV